MGTGRDVGEAKQGRKCLAEHPSQTVDPGASAQPVHLAKPVLLWTRSTPKPAMSPSPSSVIVIAAEDVHYIDVPWAYLFLCSWTSRPFPVGCYSRLPEQTPLCTSPVGSFRDAEK